MLIYTCGVYVCYARQEAGVYVLAKVVCYSALGVWLKELYLDCYYGRSSVCFSFCVSVPKNFHAHCYVICSITSCSVSASVADRP